MIRCLICKEPLPAATLAKICYECAIGQSALLHVEEGWHEPSTHEALKERTSRRDTLMHYLVQQYDQTRITLFEIKQQLVELKEQLKEQLDA